jgi:hypothetical protein
VVGIKWQRLLTKIAKKFHNILTFYLLKFIMPSKEEDVLNSAQSELDELLQIFDPFLIYRYLLWQSLQNLPQSDLSPQEQRVRRQNIEIRMESIDERLFVDCLQMSLDNDPLYTKIFHAMEKELGKRNRIKKINNQP